MVANGTNMKPLLSIEEAEIELKKLISESGGFGLRETLKLNDFMVDGLDGCSIFYEKEVNGKYITVWRTEVYEGKRLQSKCQHITIAELCHSVLNKDGDIDVFEPDGYAVAIGWYNSSEEIEKFLSEYDFGLLS